VRDRTGFARIAAANVCLTTILLLFPLSLCASDEPPSAASPLPTLAAAREAPTATEGRAPSTHLLAAGVLSTMPLVPRDGVAIKVVDEPLWTGQFTVREDGSLLLPRLPPLEAAGLTVAQLTVRLTEALKSYVIDPVVTVNLAVPVSRVVAALGALKEPGSYDLATSPTLLTLIASAGGVTPTGVLEKAVLVRGQERISVLSPDAEAPIPDDFVLQPNDVLFVPERTARAVFVLGAVTKPGMLPVTEAAEAATGIVLAGGPTAEADLRNTFILRNGVRLPADMGPVLAPEQGEAAPEAGTPLEPGDVLVVPTIRERSVFVVGGVKTPGPQPHAEAKRASKAVAMAGGAVPSGDLAGAYILRAGQRLPVDLAQVLEAGNAGADVLLEPGDALVVPEVPQTFHIVGAVAKPGVYQLAEAGTVLDGLALGGGMTNDADLWHAYLVRGDESIPVDLYALVEGTDLSQNQSLQPGDTLVVPRLEDQVYVMGAVREPGPQPIRPGDRLMDLLGRAGGIAVTAKGQAVFVYRRTTLRENEARLKLINLATGRTNQELRQVARAAEVGEEVEVLEGVDSYEARKGDVIFVPGRGASQADLLQELLRIFVYRGSFF